MLIGGIVWCYFDEFSIGGALLGVFSGIAVIVCLVIIIIAHAGTDGRIANWEQEKKAIEAKIETGLYADEFGLLDKNVINEIKVYNTDLNAKKALQRDIWLGVFVPNIYDNIQFIDYDFVPHRENSK